MTSWYGMGWCIAPLREIGFCVLFTIQKYNLLSNTYPNHKAVTSILFEILAFEYSILNTKKPNLSHMDLVGVVALYPATLLGNEPTSLI